MYLTGIRHRVLGIPLEPFHGSRPHHTRSRPVRYASTTMAEAVQKELGLEVDWPGLKTALLTATTRLHDKLAVLKVRVSTPRPS